MQALKASPHTILEFHRDTRDVDIVYAYRDERLKAFAIHIRTIQTPIVLLLGRFLPYFQLAPKLTTVSITREDGFSFGGGLSELAGDLSEELSVQKSFRSIVKGEEDVYVAAKLREHLNRRVYDGLPLSLLRGLTVTLPVGLSPVAWNEVSIFSALAQIHLIMWFKVTEGQTIITDRSFKRLYLSQSSLTEVTEEEMDRLAQLPRYLSNGNGIIARSPRSLVSRNERHSRLNTPKTDKKLITV